MKLPIGKIFEGAKTAGFTMIELLVVISVIGVLAVAVLSSINPIEQINKGRDTRTRSDAAQLINAIDRYVAIHEEYPWNTTGSISGFNSAFEFADTGWAPTVDWADLLVTTSEVKDGFMDRQYESDDLYVIKPTGYDANTIVCFQPSSNAFRSEAAESCANYSGLAGISGGSTLCPGSGDATALNYICLP